MEEQILEINGDADLEDAGTLGFGENRNNGERDVSVSYTHLSSSS